MIDRAQFDTIMLPLIAKNWAVQELEELWTLVSKVMQIAPRRILEVGVENGGTLRAWQEILPDDGLLVGVDLVDKRLVDFKSSPAVVMITGDSADSKVVQQVAEFAPYDFVFIDGDHSYKGCKSDYLTYRPLVRVGGILAFHDLNHEPVRRVWNEVAGNKEVIYHKIGIGILHG